VPGLPWARSAAEDLSWLRAAVLPDRSRALRYGVLLAAVLGAGAQAETEGKRGEPVIEVNEEALRPFIEGTISMAELERRLEAARPALNALMCPNSMSDAPERDAGD
jgi:hypothetical protein